MAPEDFAAVVAAHVPVRAPVQDVHVPVLVVVANLMHSYLSWR